MKQLNIGLGEQKTLTEPLLMVKQLAIPLRAVKLALCRKGIPTKLRSFAPVSE